MQTLANSEDPDEMQHNVYNVLYPKPMVRLIGKNIFPTLH